MPIRVLPIANRPTHTKRSSIFGLVVLASAVVVANTACEDPVPPPEPAWITLDQTTLTLTSVGETVRLAAFVIDAPPALPASTGEYHLRGAAATGAELFSLRFEMPVISHQEERGSFAFAVPARGAWASALARITLSGPAGSFTLDSDTDRPVVMLLDPGTGQVQGIYTALPAGISLADVRGGLIPIQPGLEVLFSRGIPDVAAWGR